MKTYIKPETIVFQSVVQDFLEDLFTGVGDPDDFTKQNDDWEFEEEDDGGFGW